MKTFASLFAHSHLAVLLFCYAAMADDRPNMIVITADELRWDGLSVTGHSFAETPHIDRLAREGMLFENAFVPTPLCGPSRACLITGQYAHTHGSYKNQAPKGHTKKLKTYPMLFQQAGYKTAFIGKWTTGRNGDKTLHPGFDRWFCSGVNRDYKMDPVVNVDGEWIPFKGHATDIDSAEATRFIREHHDGPFNISLWHRSVHTSYGDEHLLAAERNRDLYKDVPVPRAISAQEPLIVQPAIKGFAQRPPTDEDIRNIARMTVDIDDGVGLIYETLEELGILDETIIIFSSDNGFFFGEHGLTEKRLAYEEAIKVPFIVRYPPLIKPGTTSDVSTLSIDVAPRYLKWPAFRFHRNCKDSRSSLYFKAESYANRDRPCSSNSGLKRISQEGAAGGKQCEQISGNSFTTTRSHSLTNSTTYGPIRLK